MKGESQYLLTADEFCRKYRESLSAVMVEAKKQRGNLLLVRYEDFIRHTSDEFSRMCDFLGERCEGSAIIESNPDLRKWKVDPQLFGPIVAKTKAWTDYVTTEQARFVENHLESSMKMLSYGRYTGQSA